MWVLSRRSWITRGRFGFFIGRYRRSLGLGLILHCIQFFFYLFRIIFNLGTFYGYYTIVYGRYFRKLSVLLCRGLRQPLRMYPAPPQSLVLMTVPQSLIPRNQHLRPQIYTGRTSKLCETLISCVRHPLSVITGSHCRVVKGPLNCGLARCVGRVPASVAR